MNNKRQHCRNVFIKVLYDDMVKDNAAAMTQKTYLTLAIIKQDASKIENKNLTSSSTHSRLAVERHCCPDCCFLSSLPLLPLSILLFLRDLMILQHLGMSLAAETCQEIEVFLPFRWSLDTTCSIIRYMITSCVLFLDAFLYVRYSKK
jgi:hypothetical protein